MEHPRINQQCDLFGESRAPVFHLPPCLYIYIIIIPNLMCWVIKWKASGSDHLNKRIKHFQPDYCMTTAIFHSIFPLSYGSVKDQGPQFREQPEFVAMFRSLETMIFSWNAGAFSQENQTNHIYKPFIYLPLRYLCKYIYIYTIIYIYIIIIIYK